MALVIPRKKLIIENIESMIGGEPKKIIKDIGLDDANIEKKIIRTIDNSYRFMFTKDNTNIYEGSKYLGKGALTAVYKIKLINPEAHLDKPIHNYKDDLILRIYNNNDKKPNALDVVDIKIGEIDTNYDSQTKFVNMWTEHKKLFPENIIDMFMYGDIILTNKETDKEEISKYLGYYTLTRVYSNEKELDKLELVDKIKYFKKLLKFLIKIRLHGYTYRDLTYQNIGFDKIGDEYNFIVLDYDIHTIMKYDEVRELKKKKKK